MRKYITIVKNFLTRNTSNKQTIIKNTFWLLLAEGFGKGAFFVLTIFIARVLGPEQFGIMNFATSFVGMFIILTDFGLTTLMVRDVTKDHTRIGEYFVNANAIKLGLGLTTLVVVRLCSLFIPKVDAYLTIVLLYCAYAVVNNMGEFVRSFFRPSEKMEYEALLKIINAFLGVTIIGGALAWGYDLTHILYAYVVVGVLSLIISLSFIIHKQRIALYGLNKNLIVHYLKAGALLSIGAFATNRYNSIDQVLIGIFRTDIEVGYYAAAYKIMNIVGMIGLVLSNSLYPRIATLASQKGKVPRLPGRMEQYVWLGSVVFIVANIALSHYIIPLILGNDFVSSIPVYNVLVVSTAFLILNYIYTNILIAQTQEKSYLRSVLTCLVINAGLNILLIPTYGMYAAAVVTVITEISCFVLFRYHVARTQRI